MYSDNSVEYWTKVVGLPDFTVTTVWHIGTKAVGLRDCTVTTVWHIGTKAVGCLIVQ